MKREELIIEKQREIIANLKEVGQFYFALKGKALKSDVEKMRNLIATGNKLESELKTIDSLSPAAEKPMTAEEVLKSKPIAISLNKTEAKMIVEAMEEYASLKPTVEVSDGDIERYLLDNPHYIPIQAEVRAFANWMRELMKERNK